MTIAARSARSRAGRNARVAASVPKKLVAKSERYHEVIESDWLIPKDNLGSRPGVIRLSPDCTLEDSSKKFVGED